MDIWQAIILGVAQGLAEFLPISSSGHLVLLQQIFGIQESGLFFGVMLHVGTLIAVFVVFWKDIVAILKKPIQKLTGLLIVATVPAIIVGLFFKDTVEMLFAGKFLGWGFLVTAVVLFLSDRIPEGKKNLEQMNGKNALIVGICQAIAIVPGISRSGSTIVGSLTQKLDRRSAARFSFLMSIPAILGSAVMEVKDVIVEGTGGIPLLPVLVGMAVSAVFGYIAIRAMLKIITNKKMKYFAIYVAVVGVFVLADQFIFHWFF
ncbi:undecaprenyl-diphosphate phosphatase [Gehongia tenuis]|uniref:Undecaprenyl-diphosphatase n=1 Tax=Gehongia tenuis TaxID=2763655 RepID=A0A926D3K5_9FIRM|nr:undecaprenyl-diphosphate phosphatase [Gehongia tenuis]MBC8530264.1 undecaprenyl-diphosphate phosphatase [Gehongia tenuis]